MNIVNRLFPRHCISCWSQGAYLCKQCKKKLQPHPEICPICHRFSQDYKTCINCKSNKNFFLEGIIIPFIYTDLLKTLIIKLKYFHKKDIGEFLVERLAIALQANESFQREFRFPPLLRGGEPMIIGSEGFVHFNTSTLFISFIPSHRYRHYFIKGYNQSELLARKLSQHLQVPMIAIAKKQRHTKTQASLDRNGRMKNLNNAFSLIKNLSFTWNETLLIVDDITTTWSTINELAKCIKHYYPNIKVRWAVLWRHI